MWQRILSQLMFCAISLFSDIPQVMVTSDSYEVSSYDLNYTPSFQGNPSPMRAYLWNFKITQVFIANTVFLRRVRWNRFMCPLFLWAQNGVKPFIVITTFTGAKNVPISQGKFILYTKFSLFLSSIKKNLLRYKN